MLDEQLSQVGRRSLRGMCAERFSGNGQCARGENPQELPDVGVAEPDDGAAGASLPADRLEDPGQRGADLTGAVIEQGRQVLAEAAASAHAGAVGLTRTRPIASGPEPDNRQNVWAPQGTSSY